MIHDKLVEKCLKRLEEFMEEIPAFKIDLCEIEKNVQKTKVYSEFESVGDGEE